MSGDAPYWRRHYGMGQRWQTSPGRRGCMVMLVGGTALLVVAIVVLVLSKL